MSRTFNQLAAFSVDHRWLVVVLLAILSAVAYIGHTDPQWLLSLLPEEVPAETNQDASSDRSSEAEVPDVRPFSLAHADAVLVVQADDFFTADATAALRHVVDRLESLDQVSGVLWMDRVPVLNIFGLPEPLLPSARASKERFKAARTKALEHPLVQGQLLSGDTKTLLMLIYLDRQHLFENRDATDLLRETAEAAAAEHDRTQFEFMVTGRVPAELAAIESHESNQFTYQLVGYGMVLLMTVILFRGLRPVIIVTVAPVLGVFWTLGMIGFLEYSNPLVDVILPILVSLVGLTDGVHLMVQIRKRRSEGQSERQAARLGIQQVGQACFLTSLTTAIGFASLMLAESEWVQEFGTCAVIGVILTFIAVVTVIPLLCSTWLGRTLHHGLRESLIERHLTKVSVVVDYVLRRRIAFSILSVVLTLALFAICLTLTPDQRRSDGLPERAEATIALRHLDSAMGGLEFSRVEIEWADDIPSDSPDILNVVSEVDQLLRSEPLIGHPLSIKNLIDAQPGSGPPAERMSMIELLPPPLKRAFYSPERNAATVDFRVQDLGIATYGPVFERVEAGLAEITKRFPEFKLQLDGGAVWRWRNLYQVVVDLAQSLGTASVIIFGVLAVVYRSIRIGLISIIPNIFPLVLTGAVLALAGYNLEIVMVCNFTVCLGIAVDDTIHFLTRYLEERRENSQDIAIRRAFTGVGTALIMTTSVLVVGFATVTISESRDHRIFAMMGAITIAAALLADLLFLPALLARFAERKSADESP